MRWDDLQQSGNIEDRRGEQGGGGFHMPGGAGGLGIGTVVVLGILGWALGIDPRLLIGGAEILTGGGSQMEQPYRDPRAQQGGGGQARRTGRPEDETGRFVAAILGSTEVQWKDIFTQAGQRYRAPVLVMYRGQTSAPCGGVAQSAMGPFYCPADQKVYLDTSFFREIETRFRGCEGKACQFSQAYVIAHEVGHHVQNLLGILPKVQGQQRGLDKASANRLQVRVELQADCFAGVWASRENAAQRAKGRPPFIDTADIEAAMKTAAAIGDDTLQRRAGGAVVPDSFTHGSAAQRQRWFQIGLKEGTVKACNTFQAANL